jgi:hypothetical protein
VIPPGYDDVPWWAVACGEVCLLAERLAVSARHVVVAIRRWLAEHDPDA